MATFTYEDFMKAVEDNGLQKNFSAADLKLAQKNPDAGMSILKYKLDVKNATTPEQIAIANAGAEQIRSSYGGYTGGKNGGGFYLNPLSPGSFDFTPAPTYESQYDDDISSMLDSILNRPDFSYDPNTDPLYSQYKKAYNREGDRATADALGTAAATTGGIPSSYATAAAAQAGNYYASQLTDKIPELYELAYNKYLSDYNMDLTSLDALQAAEQANYAKYLNSLNQWNTDREFNYGQLLDEINQQTLLRQEDLDKASIAAGLGDYSMFEDMGIDTSNNPDDWERKYNLATLGAQFGDYSRLRELGINPSTVSAQKSSSTSRNTSSGSGKEKETTKNTASGLSSADVQKIKNAYGTKLTQEQWDGLKSANTGLTDAMLQAAGFSIKNEKTGSNGTSPAKSTSKSEPKIDMNSVLALGYGPISAEKLDQLVGSGMVEEYEENGMIKFRRRYA